MTDERIPSGTRPPPAPIRADDHVDDERRQLRVTIAASVLLAGIVVWEAGWPDATDAALIALPCAAFVARRSSSRVPRWATFVASLVPCVLLNVPELRTEGILFAPIAAVTYLALFEPRRGLSWACGAIALFAAPAAALITGDGDWGWPFWMLGTALGSSFGEIGHRYRLRMHELRAARQVIADQAVLEERRRIARDVHDLVGHSLSVVMLQVTAARALVRDDPDEAEAALDDAARVGRQSMGEIRRTMGLLRSEVDRRAGGDGSRQDSDAGTTTDSTVGDGTMPAPTLLDVWGLVSEYRTAGLDVALTVDGDLTTLDQPRSNAAYRIVQEALANASRHGGSGLSSVGVRHDAEECTLRITNPLGSTADPARQREHQGLGLVGMRERAESMGGSLEAEPVGSEWMVKAVLPAGTP
ncbi:MAG: histidine kinase [Actinomycetota bacterium]